ncbi:reverse transcriptase, partial [Lasius niger]
EDNDRILAEFHFQSVVDDIDETEGAERSEDRSEGDAAQGELPFKREELAKAVISLKGGKAPGRDCVTNELIKEVHKADPEWLLELYNACWRKSYFPNEWKAAEVVYFPKADKDAAQAKSYRPICLLPALGKVLDKMLTNRLMIHIESTGKLSEAQFGFRRGRSTIHALKRVTEFIDASKRKGWYTGLVALDVSNAFNSARRADIIRCLGEFEVPSRLRRLIISFLLNRRIYLGKEEWKYNVGVPQGSCMGPVLWLLLINAALKSQYGDNCFLQAFADDMLLMVRFRKAYHMTDKVKIPLADVLRWAEENSLTLNVDKFSDTRLSSNIWGYS